MAFKPDRAWVYEQVEARKSRFSAMHIAMDEDLDQFRCSAQLQNAVRGRMNAIPGLPKGYQIEYPPYAYLGVMVGVNSIIGGESPDVKVTIPKDATPKVKDDCREMQRWLAAAFSHVATYKSENPVREVVVKQRSIGFGALSYPIDYEVWADPPYGWADQPKRIPARLKDRKASVREEVQAWQRKRAEAFPWNVESVHPKNLLFDPDHDPPMDYIREEKVSRSAAVAQYPSLKDALGVGGSGDSEDLTRVTYCSEEWYGCWIDELNCLTEGADEEGIVKNTTGRCWTRMAWDGSGDTTEDHDWSMKCKGAIRDNRGTVVMLTTAVNVMNAMLAAYGFPTVTIIGGTQQERDELRSRFAVGPAAMIDAPENIKVDYLNPPPIPSIVLQEFDRAEQLYSMGYGAEVLRGEFRSEAASKYRARAVQAGLPFEAPKANAEQMCAAMARDWLMMLKYELREPVTVGGVTLRPEQVVEGVPIKVDLTPMTDEEKAYKLTEMKDLLAAGAISLRDFILETRGSEVDPDEIMKETRKEALLAAVLAMPGWAELVYQQVAGPLTGSAGSPQVPPPEAVAAPMGPAMGGQPGFETVEPPEPVAGGPMEALAGVEAVAGAPLMPRVGNGRF